MSTEGTVRNKPHTMEVDAESLPAKISNEDKGEMASAVLGRYATAVIHNFDGDRQNRWRLTAIASSSEPLGFDQIPAEGLSIKYFYANPVEIDKGQGEYVDATRVVLIDPVGRAYAFVSQGIAKGLGQIISIFGWGPYDPPLRCRVTATKTKRGHIYNIVPLSE